jgi:hypothetical protein
MLKRLLQPVWEDGRGAMWSTHQLGLQIRVGQFRFRPTARLP